MPHSPVSLSRKRAGHVPSPTFRTAGASKRILESYLQVSLPLALSVVLTINYLAEVSVL